VICLKQPFCQGQKYPRQLGSSTLLTFPSSCTGIFSLMYLSLWVPSMRTLCSHWHLRIMPSYLPLLPFWELGLPSARLKSQVWTNTCPCFFDACPYKSLSAQCSAFISSPSKEHGKEWEVVGVLPTSAPSPHFWPPVPSMRGTTMWFPSPPVSVQNADNTNSSYGVRPWEH
jgi:hypothetical protein